MSYLVIAFFFLHMEEGKTAPNWCVFTKIGPVPHYVAELLLKNRREACESAPIVGMNSGRNTLLHLTNDSVHAAACSLSPDHTLALF
jgi:hypothetical protein